MLTANERIENLEAAIVDLSNKYISRATDDELEAVRSEIFDTNIETLKSNIMTLEKTIAILKEIIATAQGK